MIASRASCFLDAGSVFAKVGIAKIGDDECDRIRVTGAQSLRPSIWLIPQLFDGFQNTLAGLIGDGHPSIRDPIEDVRNRGTRDTSTFGNINLGWSIHETLVS